MPEEKVKSVDDIVASTTIADPSLDESQKINL